MGIGNIGGSYCNLIFGTGSEEIGRMIKRQVVNRKVNNQNLISAIYKGTKKGIGYSYKLQIKNGGFFKNLIKGFKAIPEGWKKASGIKKPWGAIKGMGKAMPALFAGLAVLGEIPNLYKSVKEKGVIQGIKEVGKTAVRLTAGAIGGALGTALIPVPVLGSMGGWMLGDWIASKIVGKSYSEQVAEQETDNQENGPKTVQNEQGDSATFSGAEAPAVDSISYPPIDANDFGPYRPYANVFYNYPGAGADMGVRMPGQSYTGSINIAGSGIGMNGLRANNVSPNLLDKPVKGGDLLNPNQRR